MPETTKHKTAVIAVDLGRGTVRDRADLTIRTGPADANEDVVVSVDLSDGISAEEVIGALRMAEIHIRAHGLPQ